jgi:hypothetical protein
VIQRLEAVSYIATGLQSNVEKLQGAMQLGVICTFACMRDVPPHCACLAYVLSLRPATLQLVQVNRYKRRPRRS